MMVGLQYYFAMLVQEIATNVYQINAAEEADAREEADYQEDQAAEGEEEDPEDGGDDEVLLMQTPPRISFTFTLFLEALNAAFADMTSHDQLQIAAVVMQRLRDFAECSPHGMPDEVALLRPIFQTSTGSVAATRSPAAESWLLHWWPLILKHLPGGPHWLHKFDQSNQDNAASSGASHMAMTHSTGPGQPAAASSGASHVALTHSTSSGQPAARLTSPLPTQPAKRVRHQGTQTAAPPTRELEVVVTSMSQGSQRCARLPPVEVEPNTSVAITILAALRETLSGDDLYVGTTLAPTVAGAMDMAMPGRLAMVPVSTVPETTQLEPLNEIPARSTTTAEDNGGTPLRRLVCLPHDARPIAAVGAPPGVLLTDVMDGPLLTRSLCPKCLKPEHFLACSVPYAE